jgi:hypothetical protein
MLLVFGGYVPPQRQVVLVMAGLLFSRGAERSYKFSGDNCLTL